MNKIENVLTEIDEAFLDIPFGNSAFQTEVFALAAQVTPERVYRTIGLSIYSKIEAIKNYNFTIRKNEIKIGELREKLASTKYSKWDKMRFEIEIEEIESSYSYNEKLYKDSLTELNLLYSKFKELPKFTREQFEAAERNHFEQKMLRQVSNIQGGAESLVNMRDDYKALNSYINRTLEIQNHSDDTLELLRLDMSNQIKENN
jgi:hypothetical protein